MLFLKYNWRDGTVLHVMFSELIAGSEIMDVIAFMSILHGMPVITKAESPIGRPLNGQVNDGFEAHP